MEQSSEINMFSDNRAYEGQPASARIYNSQVAPSSRLSDNWATKLKREKSEGKNLYLKGKDSNTVGERSRSKNSTKTNIFSSSGVPYWNIQKALKTKNEPAQYSSKGLGLKLDQFSSPKHYSRQGLQTNSTQRKKQPLIAKGNLMKTNPNENFQESYNKLNYMLMRLKISTENSQQQPTLTTSTLLDQERVASKDHNRAKGSIARSGGTSPDKFSVKKELSLAKKYLTQRKPETNRLLEEQQYYEAEYRDSTDYEFLVESQKKLILVLELLQLQDKNLPFKPIDAIQNEVSHRIRALDPQEHLQKARDLKERLKCVLLLFGLSEAAVARLVEADQTSFNEKISQFSSETPQKWFESLETEEFGNENIAQLRASKVQLEMELKLLKDRTSKSTATQEYVDSFIKDMMAEKSNMENAFIGLSEEKKHLGTRCLPENLLESFTREAHYEKMRLQEEIRKLRADRDFVERQRNNFGTYYNTGDGYSVTNFSQQGSEALVQPQDSGPTIVYPRSPDSVKQERQTTSAALREADKARMHSLNPHQTRSPIQKEPQERSGSVKDQVYSAFGDNEKSSHAQDVSDTLLSTIKKLQDQLSQSISDYDLKLSNKEDQLREKDKKVTEAETRIEERTRYYAEKEESFKSTIEKLEATIKSLEAQKASMQSQIGLSQSFDSDKLTKESQISELRDSLKAKEASSAAQVSKLDQEVLDLKKSLEEANKQLLELKTKSLEEIFTLKQAVGEKDLRLKEHDQRNSLLKDSLTSKIEQLEREVAAAAKRESVHTSKESEQAGLLEKKSFELAEVNSKLGKSLEDLTQLRASVDAQKQSLAEKIKELEFEVETLNRKLQQSKEDRDELEGDFRKKIDALNLELSDMQRKFKAKNEELENVEAKWKLSAEEQRKKYLDLDELFAKTKRDAADLVDSNGKLAKNLEDERQQLAALKSHAKQKSDESAELEKELQGSKKKFAESQDAVAGLQRNIDGLKKESASLAEELATAQSRIKQLAAGLTQAQDCRDSLESEKKVAQKSLETHISDSKEREKKLALEKDSLGEELSAALKTLKETKEQLKEARDAIDAANSSHSTVNQEIYKALEKEKNRLEKRVSEVETENLSLEQQMKNHKSTIKQLQEKADEHQQQAEQLKRDFTRREAELTENSNKATSTLQGEKGETENALAKLRSEKEALEKELGQAREASSHLQTQTATLKGDCEAKEKSLQKLIEDMGKLQSEIARVQEELLRVTSEREATEKTLQQLRGEKAGQESSLSQLVEQKRTLQTTLEALQEACKKDETEKSGLARKVSELTSQLNLLTEKENAKNLEEANSSKVVQMLQLKASQLEEQLESLKNSSNDRIDALTKEKDGLETQRQRFEAQAAAALQEKQSAEKAFAGDKGLLDEQIRQLRESLSSKEADALKLQGQLDTSSRQLKDLHREKEDLLKVKAGLERDLKQEREQLASKDFKLTEQSDLYLKVMKSCESIEASFAKSELDLAAAKKELVQKEAEIRLHEQKLAQKQAEISKTAEAKQQMEQKSLEAEKQLQALTNQLGTKSETIDHLKVEHGKEVEQKETEIQELKIRVGSLQTEVNRLTDEAVAQISSVQTAESSKDQLEAARQHSIEQLQKAISDLREDSKRLEISNEQKSTRIKELELQLQSQIGTAEELDNKLFTLKSEKDSLQKLNDSLKQAAAKATQDQEAQLAAARSEIERVKSEAGEAEELSKKITKLTSDLQSKDKQIGDQIEALRELENRISAFQIQRSALSATVDTLTKDKGELQNSLLSAPSFKDTQETLEAQILSLRTERDEVSSQNVRLTEFIENNAKSFEALNQALESTETGRVKLMKELSDAQAKIDSLVRDAELVSGDIVAKDAQILQLQAIVSQLESHTKQHAINEEILPPVTVAVAHQTVAQKVKQPANKQRKDSAEDWLANSADSSEANGKLEAKQQNKLDEKHRRTEVQDQYVIKGTLKSPAQTDKQVSQSHQKGNGKKPNLKQKKDLTGQEGQAQKSKDQSLSVSKKEEKNEVYGRSVNSQYQKPHPEASEKVTKAPKPADHRQTTTHAPPRDASQSEYQQKQKPGSSQVYTARKEQGAGEHSSFKPQTSQPQKAHQKEKNQSQKNGQGHPHKAKPLQHKDPHEEYQVKKQTEQLANPIQTTNDIFETSEADRLPDLPLECPPKPTESPAAEPKQDLLETVVRSEAVVEIEQSLPNHQPQEIETAQEEDDGWITVPPPKEEIKKMPIIEEAAALEPPKQTSNNQKPKGKKAERKEKAARERDVAVHSQLSKSDVPQQTSSPSVQTDLTPQLSEMPIEDNITDSNISQIEQTGLLEAPPVVTVASKKKKNKKPQEVAQPQEELPKSEPQDLGSKSSPGPDKKELLHDAPKQQIETLPAVSIEILPFEEIIPDREEEVSHEYPSPKSQQPTPQVSDPVADTGVADISLLGEAGTAAAKKVTADQPATNDQASPFLTEEMVEEMTRLQEQDDFFNIKLPLPEEKNKDEKPKNKKKKKQAS